MIEVVAFLPVEFGVCRTCDEIANVFKIRLREPLELPDDAARLLAALAKLGPVPVRVTAPTTLRGLWLMVKYRTGKIPLVIVNGRLIHSGPVDDVEELVERIAAALRGP